jgi:hypothetical protein
MKSETNLVMMNDESALITAGHALGNKKKQF